MHPSQPLVCVVVAVALLLYTIEDLMDCIAPVIGVDLVVAEVVTVVDGGMWTDGPRASFVGMQAMVTRWIKGLVMLLVVVLLGQVLIVVTVAIMVLLILGVVPMRWWIMVVLLLPVVCHLPELPVCLPPLFSILLVVVLVLPPLPRLPLLLTSYSPIFLIPAVLPEAHVPPLLI